MKYTMCALLLVACGNPKEKIVEQQKAIQQQIQVIEEEKYKITTTQRSYVQAVNEKYQPLIRQVKSPGELRRVTMQFGKEKDVAYVRGNELNPKLDSLNSVAQSLARQYVSLDMELKKY